MGKTIDIGGRIHNPEVGNIVTGANEILDDTKNKKQDVINGEVDAALEALDANKQDNLTFDQTPTESSTNPVTSGGVYAADLALQQAIEAILTLIPSAASALNQLADKSFVNSSIATASATFRGTYNLVSDLHLSVTASHQDIATALASVVSTADNNDYCFVQIPTSDTSSDIRVTERYKFNGTAWQYEYDLNNSGFTAQQWEAINSGITALLVTKLGALPTAAELATSLAGKQNVLTFDNVPVSGSDNPVKSSGLYQLFTAIDAKFPSDASSSNKLVAENRLAAYVTAIINALDASFDLTSADGHVTFRMTQTNGVIVSVQILTSDIASASALTTLGWRVSTNETDIANLQAAYAGLTQSDVIVGALPSSGQQQNVIYRQPDPDHTPPQFYSDYMWNGTTWVLMATYNNAIDAVPTTGSHNLVESGGVVESIYEVCSYKVSAIANGTIKALRLPIKTGRIVTAISDNLSCNFYDSNRSLIKNVTQEMLPYTLPSDALFIASGGSGQEVFITVKGVIEDINTEITTINEKVDATDKKIDQKETYKGYESVFIGNGTFKELSIPIYSGRTIVELPSGIDSIIFRETASSSNVVVNATDLPYTSQTTLKYAAAAYSGNEVSVMVESVIEPLDKREDAGTHTVNFIGNGTFKPLSYPIRKGRVITQFGSSATEIIFRETADSINYRISSDDLPYIVPCDFNYAAVGLGGATVSVTIGDMLQTASLWDKRGYYPPEIEIKNNMHISASLYGLLIAVNNDDKIACFPVKKGDKVNLTWSAPKGLYYGVFQSVAVNSDVQFREDNSNINREGVANITVLSDGFFACNFTAEVSFLVMNDIRSDVQGLIELPKPKREMHISDYVRADETESSVDVTLTSKNSVFKLTKGSVGILTSVFVDFQNNKIGFYTPYNAGETPSTTVWREQSSSYTFTEGHKFKVRLQKINGCIAKLNVTDLFTGDSTEMETLPTECEQCGIAYCWGEDSYETLFGTLSFSNEKLASLQELEPVLMVLGDSNCDHGGLGSGKKNAYIRQIKDLYGSLSIFSQGGGALINYINWFTHYIQYCCQGTYCLITTANEFSSTQYISNAQVLISLLESYKITPILATIHPNGEGRTEITTEQLAINTWIKSSGYLYFDIAEIISLNHDGITIDPNLLAPDQVHFNLTANNMIFERFKIDYGYLFDYKEIVTND